MARAGAGGGFHIEWPARTTLGDDLGSGLKGNEHLYFHREEVLTTDAPWPRTGPVVCPVLAVGHTSSSTPTLPDRHCSPACLVLGMGSTLPILCFACWLCEGQRWKWRTSLVMESFCYCLRRRTLLCFQANTKRPT